MLAAMEGDLDTVRLLISAGADVSVTDQVCNKVIFIGSGVARMCMLSGHK